MRRKTGQINAFQRFAFTAYTNGRTASKSCVVGVRIAREESGSDTERHCVGRRGDARRRRCQPLPNQRPRRTR
jgi:hypothetical protein